MYKIWSLFNKVKYTYVIQTIPCIYDSISCSVMSDSLWHHGPYSTRFFCPWNSPGKNTGVGCYFLLQGSLQPREQTRVSRIAGRFFTVSTREALYLWNISIIFKMKGKKVLVAQSYLTLQSYGLEPPGSSVHGSLQSGILEWVAISFSRGSSWAKDQIWVSCVTNRLLTSEPPRKHKHNF